MDDLEVQRGGPARKVKIVKRPDGPPSFCDFANVTGGTFGFKFSFGSILRANDETMDVNEYAVIGMTAEHAQAFYQVLGKHLDGYRKLIGPIHGDDDSDADSEGDDAG